MKTTLFTFLAAVLFVVGVMAQELTKEEALKLGSDNDGAKNGSFWFEHGDATPPFKYGGHVEISQGNQISLSLNADEGEFGVDAPFSDGSQTRLDFFVSSKGKGWVTSHVLKPEIEIPPKPAEDERSPVQRALSPAAELAINKGDLAFLKTLIAQGMNVNEALDSETGATLLHKAVSANQLETVKFLLKKGAKPDIRNRYGERPIVAAIKNKNKALCTLMAGPPREEHEIEGFPIGLIEEVLPHASTNDVFFISWNSKDPSPELLAEIRKTLPKARASSARETLQRRPLGARTWYQDKETKEFGSLIEVTLNKAPEAWTASIRQSVAPIMAGGGWKANLRKAYGYWYMDDRQGWDE